MRLLLLALLLTGCASSHRADELRAQIERVHSECRSLETGLVGLEERREKLRDVREELPRLRLLVAELRARR